MSSAAVEYDPFSPEVMADPYPIYRELRARHRAYRIDEYDAWALPRFDDVWRVLSDRERFSIVEGPVFHRDRLLRHNDGAPDTTLHRPVRSFSMLDPPHHTRLRQAMIDPFRPRAVARLEDDVRALAAAQLDALAERGGFDVRHDYASPVAAAVAARLIDVPPADGVALVTLVNRYVQREPGEAGISAEGMAARREIDDYLRGFVAARRRAPRARRDPPDIVDGLLAFDGGDGPLDDAEVIDQLVTLFIGGTETLPKVVAGGAYQLWRHPEQRAAVAADPALAVPAFEEMLRYELPLQFVGRTLLVDAEIAGRVDARRPTSRARADLGEPRRARVRRARSLRRPPPDGAPPRARPRGARLHRRARRPSRGGRDDARAARALPRLRGRRVRART